MKTKLILPIAIVIVFLTSVFLYMKTQPKVMNEWPSEKLTVLTNKVWNIEFSRTIERESISKDSIYVTDNNGKRQEISLSISEDLKSVAVLPPMKGYDASSPYFTLHIEDELKTPRGRQLQTGKQVSFVVNEDLPVVGSKSKLNEIFAAAIKREKENRRVSLFSTDTAVEEKSMSAEDSAGNEAEMNNYSETNNQVAGVDEADTVKTDGTHIYQIVDNKVLITKALPASKMELTASITYKSNFSPSQLFLYQDQIVVIGHSYEDKIEATNKRIAEGEESLIWPGYYYSTTALVYDITDKKNPKQIRDIEVEGSFVTARRINEYVYLVSSHYPDIWTLENEEDLDLRPRYYDSAISNEKKMVDYNDIQYIPNSKETNFTIIGAFNLNQPSKEVTLSTYLGSGNQVYMSKENLYLAVTNYSDGITLERDGFYAPDTNIFKFSVDNEAVKLESSTDVPGTVLNQFSMDEYKGNFRIATTKGDTWNDERPSANNLYIFDENLKRVGELQDLARGERIYSARFMQDRIYIVTFKEVDPLFVIDASNPTKPTVLGELKIPGFSNYLHPYDENHLIGVGHDTKVVPSKQAGEEPLVLTQGVKLSLFDVSDVLNPKEKFSEIIGGRGTYTPLNHDHKALLFNKASGLFAFPISIYHDVEGSEYEQKFEFQGAYVYNVTLEDGFSLQKKISHLEGNPQYEEWEDSITRVIYIEDHLYAISPTKMTAYQIGKYQLVGEVNY